MLNSGEAIQIFNYIISTARNNHGGGSVILIRKDVNFGTPFFPNFITLCNDNGVNISIIYIYLNNNKKLYITSFYSPPRSTTNHTEPGFWEDTFQFFIGLGNIIITRDFNGHADLQSGGFFKPNIEGKDIEKAVSLCDQFRKRNRPD